jgi:hypothetical protein
MIKMGKEARRRVKQGRGKNTHAKPQKTNDLGKSSSTCHPTNPYRLDWSGSFSLLAVKQVFDDPLIRDYVDAERRHVSLVESNA